MTILFLIVTVIIVTISIQINNDRKREESQQSTILKYQDKFELTFSNKLSINNFLFGVDKEKKRLLIIPPKTIDLKLKPSVKDEKTITLATKWSSTYSPHCVDFKEIIGVEIKKDGETITKAGLGMPIAGGILFGGAGAITGSVLGKKTTKDSSKVSLLLQFNNFEHSVIEIPITKKDDPQFVKTNNISQLDTLCVWLKLILQDNEQQSQLKNNSNVSNLDELEKLASLKDKGIITEEEFNLKKKQLLGI